MLSGNPLHLPAATWPRGPVPCLGPCDSFLIHVPAPSLAFMPSHFRRAATVTFQMYDGSCSSSTSIPPMASHLTRIIKSKRLPAALQAPRHLMCHRVHFNTESPLFTPWPYGGRSRRPPSRGLGRLGHSFLRIRLDRSFLQSVTASLLLLKSQLTHHIHREPSPVPA